MASNLEFRTRNIEMPRLNRVAVLYGGPELASG
jgi:hypothetical protein